MPEEMRKIIFKKQQERKEGGSRQTKPNKL
jgi:hypothetical protein